eukprot:g596.t1
MFESKGDEKGDDLFDFGDQTSSEEVAHLRKKYDDIIQILLSGGYFRVRIANLPPFDKVVGGLCWAITASGADVHVDLFYDESLSLGQKIKLCEKIVFALREMQCPFVLQANQIQGNDFNALHPIFKWLVKSVIEWRAATGDVVRNVSEVRFEKNYCLPEEEALGSANFLGGLADRYRVRRVYKRPKKMWQLELDEDTMVQSCLLEYGEKAALRDMFMGSDQDMDALAAEMQSVDPAAAASLSSKNKGGAAGGGGGGGGDSAGNIMDAIAAKAADRQKRVGSSSPSKGPGAGSPSRLAGFEKEYAAAQRAAEAEAEKRLAAEESREKELLENMASVDSAKTLRVNKAQMGALVGQESAEIAAAAAAYAEEAKKIEGAGGAGDGSGGPGGAQSKRGQEVAHRRRVAGLVRQRRTLEAKIEIATDGLEAAKGRVERILAEERKRTAYNERVINETAKLAALEEKTEFKADLAKLKKLVGLNEQLRGQEAAFKENCARQLKALKAALKQLNEADDDADEDSQRLAQIENMHAEVLAKYNKLRLLLAHKSQGIATVARHIDDVPTRTELLQYERRFVELYEQVASKLEETRKYFDTYNVLKQKRDFLQREVTQLQQIHENFPAAFKAGKASQGTFLTSMNAIVAGLEQTFSKISGKLDESKGRQGDVNDQYQKLIEKQRRYFKAVKEFQEECDRNEKLTDMLEKKG